MASASAGSSGKKDGPTCPMNQVEFVYANTRSNSITTSDALFKAAGIAASASTKFKAGALFTESNAEIGFNAITVVATERPDLDTWTYADTFEIKNYLVVHIRAHHHWRITAVVKSAKVEDSAWQGELTVMFRNRQTSVSCSRHQCPVCLFHPVRDALYLLTAEQNFTVGGIFKGEDYSKVFHWKNRAVAH